MLPEEEKNKQDLEEKAAETAVGETEEKVSGKERDAEQTEKKDKKKKGSSKSEEFEKKIKELEDKNAELSDRFLRKVAEFDNYRKRTDREKLESVSLGVSNALQNMLPVYDALALAAEAECADETYKKGVEMTLQTFRNALEKLDVREMDVLGQPFDPKFHNAVMSEAVEGVESGTVTKVLQRGFMQGDRVLRFAMVAVAE